MLVAWAHAVCLQDLEFKRKPFVLSSTPRGIVRYLGLERIGMPKIPANILNAVFYLYESKADADAGQNPSGTGFIVGWNKGPSLGGPYHFYAVTNWHVAVDESDPDHPPCPVIRLNTKDDKTVVIELKPSDWYFVPNGPDVAVAPLEIASNILRWSYVPTDLFAQVEDIHNGNVAVGDDVFMAGLFIDHDGGAVNVPSSRFGNISVMPTHHSMIEQDTGMRAPVYVIDMHSRSGFSGSPVFVYRTPGQDLTTPIEMQFQVQIDKNWLDRSPLRTEDVRVRANTIFNFLGIHIGQFAEEWETRDTIKVGAESKKRGLIKDRAFVKGWSGMTVVVPAWDIIHVLENVPELVAMRREKDDKRRPNRKRPVSEKINKMKKILDSQA